MAEQIELNHFLKPFVHFLTFVRKVGQNFSSQLDPASERKCTLNDSFTEYADFSGRHVVTEQTSLTECESEDHD